jgi:hypothetical protein
MISNVRKPDSVQYHATTLVQRREALNYGAALMAECGQATVAARLRALSDDDVNRMGDPYWIVGIQTSDLFVSSWVELCGGDIAAAAIVAHEINVVLDAWEAS